MGGRQKRVTSKSWANCPGVFDICTTGPLSGENTGGSVICVMVLQQLQVQKGEQASVCPSEWPAPDPAWWIVFANLHSGSSAQGFDTSASTYTDNIRYNHFTMRQRKWKDSLPDLHSRHFMLKTPLRFNFTRNKMHESFLTFMKAMLKLLLIVAFCFPVSEFL